MTHTATILGQEFDWKVTLPDEIHLSQGLMLDTDPNPVFYLDDKHNNQPLTISIQ